MKSEIKALSIYLPKKILSNEEIDKLYPEWEINKLARISGVINRHISADGEVSSDMAFKAAENMFSEYNIPRKSIDFIIFCTQSSDYITPTTACILQTRLKIPTSAGALDYNLGCTGYIYGLGMAKALIETSQAKNVLLLTAETITKCIHYTDKNNRMLFGDGASATLISKAKDSSKSYIDSFIYGSSGHGYKNIIIKYGGNRYPLQISEYPNFHDKYGKDGNFYMNGTAVFKFSVKKALSLIKQTLKKHKLEIDDIDMFVMHQANRLIIDTIRVRAKIPKEKMLISIKDTGNTVCSTIPIALKDAFNNNLIKKGDKVMLVAFGVGYSWGSCVLTI